MSDFDEVKAAIEVKAGEVESFGKKIKLELDGESLIIDGTTNPPSVLTEDIEVDITVTTTAEVFSKILNKKMNPQMAMMTGKLKMKGDMMAAVPLMNIF